MMTELSFLGLHIQVLVIFTFIFMHLADAFIQSDYHIIRISSKS